MTAVPEVPHEASIVRTDLWRASKGVVVMMQRWAHGVDRRTDFQRSVDVFLGKIQEELMPEKAKMVVAINMETGEYALGEDSKKAFEAYHKRWPHTFYYMCRVDGTPSMRM